MQVNKSASYHIAGRVEERVKDFRTQQGREIISLLSSKVNPLLGQALTVMEEQGRKLLVVSQAS